MSLKRTFFVYAGASGYENVTGQQEINFSGVADVTQTIYSTESGHECSTDARWSTTQPQRLTTSRRSNCSSTLRCTVSLLWAAACRLTAQVDGSRYRRSAWITNIR